MEGFIAPSEEEFPGLVVVSTVSDSRINRMEVREGDPALRGT